jgi:hypothetical protein
MGQGAARLRRPDPERAKLRRQAEKNGLYSTAVGPIGWAFLHCTAAQFPHDMKQLPESEQQVVRARYRDFLKSFAAVFPCTPCSHHFAPKVATIDDKHFGSRTAFCRYVYDLHNTVTDEIEARATAQQETVHNTARPTFEQTLTLYESLRCPPSELRKPGQRIHAIIKFQRQRERDSIQISRECALTTPEAVANHIAGGGWCPSDDAE